MLFFSINDEFFNFFLLPIKLRVFFILAHIERIGSVWVNQVQNRTYAENFNESFKLKSYKFLIFKINRDIFKETTENHRPEL